MPMTGSLHVNRTNTNRQRLVDIFTFDALREFLKSWGITPRRESGSTPFNWLTTPVYLKMIEEAKRHMWSSQHGAVLADFLKLTVASNSSVFCPRYAIKPQLMTWQHLEVCWLEFLEGKR